MQAAGGLSILTNRLRYVGACSPSYSKPVSQFPRWIAPGPSEENNNEKRKNEKKYRQLSRGEALNYKAGLLQLIENAVTLGREFEFPNCALFTPFPGWPRDFHPNGGEIISSQ